MALSLIKGGPNLALLSESSDNFISSDSLPPPSEYVIQKVSLMKINQYRRYSM